MGRATLFLHEKFYLDDETVVEMKVWKVTNDERFPEGFKYSLFATREGRIIIGYDNHHPKGHHCHKGMREYPYNFINIDYLIEDFLNDLMKEGGKKQ